MARAGLSLEQIIQTAVELADQDGADAVTLANIARKLSVRPPSLFNHIKGLTQVKRELTLYGLRKLYETLQNTSYEKSGDAAILAMAEAYLQFTFDHPGLYEFTISVPQEQDTEIELVANKIVQLIIAAMSEYQLSEDDSIHAVRGLRSILHGFSSLQQKGGFGLPQKLEESLQLVVKAYLTGLKQL